VFPSNPNEEKKTGTVRKFCKFSFHPSQWRPCLVRGYFANIEDKEQIHLPAAKAAPSHISVAGILTRQQCFIVCFSGGQFCVGGFTKDDGCSHHRPQ
jgi:hypothetical protein